MSFTLSVTKILPDAFKMAQLGRHLQLGANSVRAGHQHRVGVSAHGEQPGKSTAAVKNLRPMRQRRERLDTVLQPVHCVQGHAGGLIRANIRGTQPNLSLRCAHDALRSKAILEKSNCTGTG